MAALKDIPKMEPNCCSSASNVHQRFPALSDQMLPVRVELFDEYPQFNGGEITLKKTTSSIE